MAKEYKPVFYRVGIKLDDKSFKDFTNQAENKLNTVVSNVTKEIAKMKEEVQKGTQVDMSPLVETLASAQQEIRGFTDADFSLLKQQVADMNTQFTQMTKTMETFGTKLTGITGTVKAELDTLSSNLNEKIELYAMQPKVMKERMLTDIKSLINEASRPNLDVSKLEDDFYTVIKQMQLVNETGKLTTKPLLEGFLDLGEALRNIGPEADKMRHYLVGVTKDFTSMWSRGDKDLVWENTGFKFDALSRALIEETERLAQTEKQQQDIVKKFKNNTEELLALDKYKVNRSNLKFDGNKITSREKNLGLSERIDEIAKYDAQLKSLEAEVGSEKWIKTSERRLNLIINIEKEIAKLKADDATRIKWNEFTDEDVEYTTNQLDEYAQKLHTTVTQIEKDRERLARSVATKQNELSKITVDYKEDQLKKTVTDQVTGSTKSLSDTINIKLEEKVKLLPYINQNKWESYINSNIRVISEQLGKINVDIEIPKATLNSLKRQILGLKDVSFVDEVKQTTKTIKTTNKSGKEVEKKQTSESQDVANFKERMDKLVQYIKNNKTAFLDEITKLSEEIEKVLKFRVEISGLGTEDTTNLSNKVVTLVSAINKELVANPLEFQSNIETIVQKINDELAKIGDKTINLTANTSFQGSAPVVGGIPVAFVQTAGALGKLEDAAQAASDVLAEKVVPSAPVPIVADNVEVVADTVTPSAPSTPSAPVPPTTPRTITKTIEEQVEEIKPSMMDALISTYDKFMASTSKQVVNNRKALNAA